MTTTRTTLRSLVCPGSGHLRGGRGLTGAPPRQDHAGTHPRGGPFEVVVRHRSHSGPADHRPRRGAGRGVISLAVTSLATNQLAKRIWKRSRPDRSLVPFARRARRMPTSNSLPSGHSASAAAFAVGVGLENPPLGLGLALRRPGRTVLVATGAHHPGDVLAGFGIGAGIAVLGGRWVPPIVPPRARPGNRCGSSLRNAPRVGRSAGRQSGVRQRHRHPCDRRRKWRSSPTPRSSKSRKTMTQKLLRDAARRADVWPSAAATAPSRAPRQSRSRQAFHSRCSRRHIQPFRQDIGCPTVDATVDAIKTGSVACVDVITLNEEDTLLNTASIGAYPDFVRRAKGLNARSESPWQVSTPWFKPAPRQARANPLRQQGFTDFTVLSRQLRLPAVGICAFPQNAHGRRSDRCPDSGDRQAIQPIADPRRPPSRTTGRSPLYHELQVPGIRVRGTDGPLHRATARSALHGIGRRSKRTYRALQVFQPLDRS